MNKKAMTDDHIKNRIKWLEKQIIDPYDVCGDCEDSNFTLSCIASDNEDIEKEIEELKQELERRSE